MLSSEENAGTVSECLPEMFVVHSPVDGSITDETSEHSQSQSKNVTVISTSDDRKGNDEKKSGSSARAVRETRIIREREIRRRGAQATSSGYRATWMVLLH